MRAQRQTRPEGTRRLTMATILAVMIALALGCSQQQKPRPPDKPSPLKSPYQRCQENSRYLKSCQPLGGKCKTKGIWRCDTDGNMFCYIGQHTERCNGEDDDCNGKIDETPQHRFSLKSSSLSCFYNIGYSCRIEGKKDHCQQGKFACVGGAIVCRSTYVKKAEVCNGKDDDCDGQIDNGIPKRKEICNGKDDDCDGQIDNGVPRSKELCNGKDDDCNGKIDDHVREVEVCNNKDDDCDGEIDEALVRPCASGSAQEWARCQRGKWACSRLAASRKACNGLDDDGNGKIDENCVERPYLKLLSQEKSTSSPTSPGAPTVGTIRNREKLFTASHKLIDSFNKTFYHKKRHVYFSRDRAIHFCEGQIKRSVLSRRGVWAFSICATTTGTKLHPHRRVDAAKDFLPYPPQVLAKSPAFLYLSDDDTFLAMVYRNQVQFWDVGKMRLSHTLSHRENLILAARFRRSHREFIYCTRNKCVFWDLSRQEQLWQLSFPQPLSNITLTQQPKGRYLGISGDKTLHLVDMLQGKLVRTFQETRTESRLKRWSLHPTIPLLAYTKDQIKVELWSIAQGTLVGSFTPKQFSIQHLAFHPKGKLLLLASSKVLQFWDWQTKLHVSAMDYRSYKEIATLSFQGHGHYIQLHYGDSSGAILERSHDSCPPYLTLHQGRCRDIRWDDTLCGKYKTDCTKTYSHCQGGECKCSEGSIRCQGMCTDIMRNDRSCGSCISYCGPVHDMYNMGCANGRCVYHRLPEPKKSCYELYPHDEYSIRSCRCERMGPPLYRGDAYYKD